MTLANGVFGRDGKWFMDPSLVKGVREHGIRPMPKCEVGPFDSSDIADAAASYVFAQWVVTGNIPSTEDCVRAVTAPPPEKTE